MSKPVTLAATHQVRDTCLCLHAQRAARALARRFDEVLRPAGLTNQQFSLLMALNAPEPPGMGSVASLLAMDRTTLTAALKPLERRGLLAVRPDAKDRRGRRIVLTDAGRATLARAYPLWCAAHGELEETLPVDAEGLRAALRGLSSPLPDGRGAGGEGVPSTSQAPIPPRLRGGWRGRRP